MRVLVTAVCSVLFLCCTLTPLLAETAEEEKDEVPALAVTSTIDLYAEIKYRERATPRVFSKWVYPQLSSETSTFSSAVDDFNRTIQMEINDAWTTFRNSVADNQAYAQNLPKDRLKNAFYLDYSAAVLKPGRHLLISIRLGMQTYLAGMAHPSHRYQVINYDLRTGEELSLEDLFLPDSDYLSLIATYCAEALAKKLPADAFLRAGTAPTEENYQLWNWHPDGLLITFEEYQVAPYVYGAQTVVVPYTLLEPLLAKDAPITVCAQKPARCRTSLLSGGFA